jgi:hypothetical protein
LFAVAVALMVGGVVTLIGGWVAAAVAIPAITIVIALVAIEEGDVYRQQAKHSSGM